MLASHFRLTSPADFRRVKDKGRTISSTNFTLGVYERRDEDVSRFGIIVPTKVIPRAVDRNRVKRVLSEATRFQLTYLSPGFDCVFLPKTSMLGAYTADVMKEVKEAFVQAGITK